MAGWYKVWVSVAYYVYLHAKSNAGSVWVTETQHFFYNKGKKTYAAWVISPFLLTCVFYSFILVYFYEFVYAKNNHELM